MTVFAIITFGISLIGICALFILKYWETGTGRVLAPVMRQEADERARELKERLFHLRADVAHMGPLLVLFVRYLIHEGALAFAGFARIMEAQAHRLAELVSHQHTFVPRETKSEFLKRVSEHKNGGGQA